MKFTYVLAAAGVASAQNFAGIPACATGCLASAISAVGCPPGDAGCQCGPSKAAVGASVAPCLIRSCGAADLASAASVGEALCVQYSATATGASSSSSAGSNTGGPIATTTTSSTSLAGSSTTTTTSAPTFQTTPPQTTGRTNGTTGGSGGVGGGNGTVSSGSPNPSTTRQPGAAAVASPIMMGFGAVAAVIGAVAAL